MNATPLKNAIDIVKEPWRPGDEDTAYIGLEHINENDLSLNGIGRSIALESNKFRFRAKDILFGKLRPYFRKVVMPDFDGVCSTDIWVMRAREGYDQRFMFYFMANPVLVSQSSGASTGTKMPRADWGFLGNTLWNFPTLVEQQEIAKILSSLDEKIGLLKHKNEALEQIARNMFTEWFVKPTTGALPSGWRIGTLGEEFQIIMGQSPKGETFNEAKDGMVFFQGRTDFQWRFPKTRLYTTTPTRVAEPTDVLVSVRAPVGDINVALEQCCIGRGLAAIRGVAKSYTLYKVLSLQEVIRAFDAEGTVFGSVSKTDLANVCANIPPTELMERFERAMSPLDNQILNNSRQIDVLSNTREMLLPKFMSSEIRI